MKIGFDAKRLFCNNTGLGNYSRTLVHDLAHVYPQQEYHLYTTALRRTPATGAFLDNPVFHKHMPGSVPAAIWRSYSINSDLRRDGIDLYHGLSNELPLRIDRSGIKSVVTIHDLIFKVYPDTYGLAERLIYDAKFRYACKHADRIVAISNNTKNDLVRFYDADPGKIDVILQACHPQYYTLRSQHDNEFVRQRYQLPPQYLLYVGTVEARKNLKAVIHALRLLPAALQQPLVVVGKGGTYREQMIRLAAELGLADKVIWLNNLQDNTHLQSVYQMASVLVYPSYYEGFGLPVAEALFCRTPVISAGTSSLGDAGGPDSIYVNPDNAEELSAAMQRVLTDEVLADQMRTQGHAYAQKYFTGAAAAGHMMDCYERCMAG